ncbi:MAG: heme exporter protein [Actinomycetota bacterium]|nr:heme exporter protein [Actinomycetota bacterium]
MPTAERQRSKRSALTTLGIAAWGLLAVAVYLMLFVARESCDERCASGKGPDASGGPLQRIFYFHVPAAWVAYLAFTVVFIASIAYLKTNARRWDLLAHAGAEIGVVFMSIVLITGPIWAHPVWGTWWQWDARLTSAFLMWLTYVGYLLLRGLVADPSRVGRLAAVIGIVGLINVPIVHFSVYWWRTQHPSGPSPGALDRSSGLGAPELLAFFTALAAFTLLFAWLLALRTRLGRVSDEVESLELSAARSEARATEAPRPGLAT